MRKTPEKLLSMYTKEQLERLYDDHRNIYKVADTVGCDYATLVKVFKRYGITVGKFLHKKSAVKKLDYLAKDTLEKLLLNHTLEEIAKLNNSHRGQIVARMKEVGVVLLRKRPQHRNQSTMSVPDNVFVELVDYHGVLALAKELSCSQSTIRDRAKSLNIELVAGPHKALTSTEEWKKMHMESSLKGVVAGSLLTKNTSIEIALQKELTSRGIIFDLHPKLINLTVPDAFVAPNIAIYADGCYWHGCDKCGHQLARPAALNHAHDKFVNSELLKAGYKVVRVWEHEIKSGDFSKLSFLFNSF